MSGTANRARRAAAAALALALATIGGGASAGAQEREGAAALRPLTKEVIEQRVDAGVALLETQGFDAACTGFSRRDGPFLQDEAYLFVLTADGSLICHPRPDLLGVDTGRRSYVPDMIANAAAAAPKGAWTAYPWPHPVSRRVDRKETYCRFSGALMVCAGAHFGGVS